MKGKQILTILISAFGFAFCHAGLVSAAPMSTAWTYQGRLIDANDAADGEYDFEFKLFDDPCKGTQQGVTIEVDDLDVIDDYFTVELDFRSSVFEGEARWLEIAVRPGESKDPRDFVTLTPRQEVTPAPYAIYALNAQDSQTLDRHEASDFAGKIHVHSGEDITTGTVHTSRYSAYDDLGVEGYLGNAAGSLAQNNGILQEDLNADKLDGLSEGYFFRLSQNEAVTGLPAFNGGDSASTPPFYVGSTYRVGGLNSDMLDGLHESSFYTLNQNEMLTGIPYMYGGTSGSSPPFYVDSTYRVTNLNADMLDGLHEGAFFQLDQDEIVTARPYFWGGTSGSTPPFYVDSSFSVSNLNADYLDGYHAAAFAASAHHHDALYVNVTGDSMTGPLDAYFDVTLHYAMKGEGQNGPTNGYLGVQGNDSFDGVTSTYWSGHEIGVAGISTGSTAGDNYGVLGHASEAGVRGEYSGDPNNYGELGRSGYGAYAHGTSYGVYGVATNPTGSAIEARATHTSGTNVALYANTSSSNGYAGYFVGGRSYFNGNVGIGTPNPEEKLHVAGHYIRVNGGGGENVYLGGDGFGNDVQLGSTNPDVETVALWNSATNERMNLVVGMLEIAGGSDLAEGFEISSESGEIQPGMVVCIDPDNSGNLVVSRKAYDRTVAGIVSGAGGVKTGMLMGQKGTTADGEHPIALTGRVYCRADASNDPIKAGDLLTTSDVAGHAMKVTDYDRAQGAILGKAMNSLDKGRGLVLVLVSLQ